MSIDLINNAFLLTCGWPHTGALNGAVDQTFGGKAIEGDANEANKSIFSEAVRHNPKIVSGAIEGAGKPCGWVPLLYGMDDVASRRRLCR